MRTNYFSVGVFAILASMIGLFSTVKADPIPDLNEDFVFRNALVDALSHRLVGLQGGYIIDYDDRFELQYRLRGKDFPKFLRQLEYRDVATSLIRGAPGIRRVEVHHVDAYLDSHKDPLFRIKLTEALENVESEFDSPSMYRTENGKFRTTVLNQVRKLLKQFAEIKFKSCSTCVAIKNELHDLGINLSEMHFLDQYLLASRGEKIDFKLGTLDSKIVVDFLLNDLGLQDKTSEEQRAGVALATGKLQHHRWDLMRRLSIALKKEVAGQISNVRQIDFIQEQLARPEYFGFISLQVPKMEIAKMLETININSVSPIEFHLEGHEAQDACLNWGGKVETYQFSKAPQKSDDPQAPVHMCRLGSAVIGEWTLTRPSSVAVRTYLNPVSFRPEQYGMVIDAMPMEVEDMEKIKPSQRKFNLHLVKESRIEKSEGGFKVSQRVLATEYCKKVGGKPILIVGESRTFVKVCFFEQDGSAIDAYTLLHGPNYSENWQLTEILQFQVQRASGSTNFDP